MFKSEIEADRIIEKLNIESSIIKEQVRKNLLHYLRLTFGEYGRLPRKLKKTIETRKVQPRSRYGKKLKTGRLSND